ncbi:S-phase kinase-associated protein 2-like [Epargyreus clarus]|uniref:S-phase kinase-associated protein 2-like n=1 Tax=Epargyreus clarus TaxID=520877 RepID=UPI003C302166
MTVLESEDNFKGTEALPDELWIHIFKCLPLEDLLNCELVCNRWSVLAQDSAVWRNIVVVYNERQSHLNVPEKTLSIISSHANLIRCIKLQSVDSYATVELVTKICNNLTSLELIMCRIGQDFVSYIIRWPRLRKINLRNCYTGPVNEFDFSIQYDHFKELKYLALSDFGLSSTNCSTLLQCQYLSHILIEKIKGLQLNFIRELVLSKQKILKTLHIYGGDAIDDDCLQLIAQCPFLTDLAIIRCENLRDQGFAALANINHMKHLQIWNNNNFTEKVLLHTLGSPAMVNLQRLSFSKIQHVSPVVVDLISEHYKNLKFLALYQCPKIINTDYEKQLKSKFRNIDVVLY